MRIVDKPASVLRAVAVCAVLAVGPANAEAPRIAPGKDPGGPALAIIAPDIDFQLPEMQARLARDGEGEAIAWDFASTSIATPAAMTAVSTATLVRNVAASNIHRIVPIRFEAGNAGSLARALAFAASTPAQLAIMTVRPDTATLKPVIDQAAERLPNLLIITPPVTPPTGGSATAKAVAEKTLSTILTVAPAGTETLTNNVEALIAIEPGQDITSPDAHAAALAKAAHWIVTCGGLNDKRDKPAGEIKTELLSGATAGADGTAPLQLLPCSEGEASQ